MSVSLAKSTVSLKLAEHSADSSFTSCDPVLAFRIRIAAQRAAIEQRAAHLAATGRYLHNVPARHGR